MSVLRLSALFALFLGSHYILAEDFASPGTGVGHVMTAAREVAPSALSEGVAAAIAKGLTHGISDPVSMKALQDILLKVFTDTEISQMLSQALASEQSVDALRKVISDALADPRTTHMLKNALSNSEVSHMLAHALSHEVTVDALKKVLLDSLSHEKTARMISNALSTPEMADMFARAGTQIVDRKITKTEDMLKRVALRCASYVALGVGFGFVCKGISVAWNNYADIRTTSYNPFTATIKSLCNWQFLGGSTALIAGLIGLRYSATPHIV